jgi:putative transposase
MILVEDPVFSIGQQCSLLGLSRSTLYYQPREPPESTLILMNAIDRIYTACPFYGSRKIVEVLKIEGLITGRDRVRGLMRQMGISAIYPKRNLSLSNKEHKKYPYLLRNLKIENPDQVWSTDITYIRLQRGFMYLTAVIDWFSRYVLAWELSNSLSTDFCLEVLEKALSVGKPQIFNTDQGAQYTSSEFISQLKEAGVQISMDGKGRALDNVFIERLWRSVKYEDIYIKNYESISELRSGLETYFDFYNHSRLHQSLGYKTPAEIYIN